MSAIWRVRLKDGTTDCSSDAWKKGEIGIWYGGWSAADFYAAIGEFPNDAKKVAWRLSGLPAQKAVDWRNTDIPLAYVQTAFRFLNISAEDWIVVYLHKERQIGLAKLLNEMRSSGEHEFNCANGEVYKYRTIAAGTKKCFPIDDLPDAYRLIGSQGRGNIHRFLAMSLHVELLAECEDAQAVRRALHAKDFVEQLDFLGAAGWESFALAYLVITEKFVPTGLSCGRTLPVADIVGRRFTNGGRIIAQCKKNASPVEMDVDFVADVRGLGKGDRAFYFAYGGCEGQLPVNVEVIDREKVLKWADSVEGQQYRRLLFNE